MIVRLLINPCRMLLFSNHAISFSLQSHTPLHVSRCTSPFKGGRARAPRRGLNTAPPRWRQKSGWGLSSLCPMRMTECCRTGFDLGRKACKPAATILEGLCLWWLMFLPYGDRFLPLGTKPAHAACSRILGGYPPVEVFLPYGVSFCPLAQTKPAGCCPVLPSRSTSGRCFTLREKIQKLFGVYFGGHWEITPPICFSIRDISPLR